MIRDLSPARTATLTTSTSTLAAEVGLAGRLTALLRRWSLQAPSTTLDPVTSWSAVVAHRSDCFEAIEVCPNPINHCLGLVLFASYTVCVNHVVEQVIPDKIY